MAADVTSDILDVAIMKDDSMTLQGNDPFSKKTTVGGFTLLECMIVLAIISLLAAITIPSMVHARTTSQMNDCISNLKQVDAATQQWAIENNAGVGTPITAANIRPYLGRGSSGSIQSVFCPADMTKQFDNSYTITDTVTKPSCVVLPSTHLLP